MNVNKLIFSTVAVSALMLGGATIAPHSFSLVNVAQAETNISVNFGFGTFYDRLEPYGSWVSLEDQYVFVPEHVERDWRPYTLGHWSYTNRYGWLWVSNERFGWATYHYGRWGHSRDIGWYWVPGHRWAPAWVAWSHSQKQIAWAPLPPRRGNDVDFDVSISIGDVPDYYWQAVPTSAFLSINLSDKVIRDRAQVNTIVQQNAPQTVRIENNVVINNVIQINEIETATNTKVQVLEERAVNTPDAAEKIDAKSVAIFNPEVEVDTAAKPKKAVRVEEIATQRKAQGIQPTDMNTDQSVVAAPVVDKNGKPIPLADQPATTTPVTDKNGKPTKPATVISPDVKVQDKVDANKPTDAKPAVITPPVTAAPVTEAPAGKTTKIEPTPTDTTKKALDSPVIPDTPQTLQPKQNEQQSGDQQKNKKPKKAGSDVQVPADVAPPKKGEKRKDKCDPNIEDCPPVQ